MLTRSVEFTVDSKTGAVSPRIPQYGGVRGEHNVTRISILTKPALFADADVVRLSFTLGDGSVVSSDIIDDVTIDGSYAGVGFVLPRLLTQTAGQLCARLVLSTIDDNGEETVTFRSGEMVLWFEDAALENGTPFWTGVSEMLHRTASAKETAVSSAQTADAAAKEAEAQNHGAAESYRMAKAAAENATASASSASSSAQTADAAAKEAEAQNHGAAESCRMAKAAAENAAASASAAASSAAKAASAYADSVHYRGAMSGLVAYQLADKRQSDVFYCVDSGKQGFYIYNGENWESLKGANGITPHIGENGNWFIGTTDTGVSANGDPYTLTDADKEEITQQVLATLPVWNGGDY